MIRMTTWTVALAGALALAGCGGGDSLAYAVETDDPLYQQSLQQKRLGRTSEALATARLLSVSEALRKVPGLHVREEEGLGLRPNIGIRGLNPNRASAVLLLEDGVPMTIAPYGDNAAYYHPPVNRFSRIEVLKGSGQILFGPRTIGGVINYILSLIHI